MPISLLWNGPLPPQKTNIQKLTKSFFFVVFFAVCWFLLMFYEILRLILLSHHILLRIGMRITISDDEMFSSALKTLSPHAQVTYAGSYSASTIVQLKPSTYFQVSILSKTVHSFLSRLLRGTNEFTCIRKRPNSIWIVKQMTRGNK